VSWRDETTYRLEGRVRGTARPRSGPLAPRLCVGCEKRHAGVCTVLLRAIADAIKKSTEGRTA